MFDSHLQVEDKSQNMKSSSLTDEPIYSDKDYCSTCTLSEADYERFLLLFEKIVNMDQSSLLHVEVEVPSSKLSTSLYQDYRDFIGIISARDTGIYWPKNSFRQAPTFLWIMSHPSYSAWENQLSPSILHIHGKIGSGKTFLASLLLENLLTSSRYPNNHCVLRFSFHSARNTRSSMANLYTSFICQLLSQQPSLFRHIQKQFAPLKTRSTWETSELLLLFQSLIACQNGNRITCAIDAIDECVASEPKTLEDLAMLQRNTESAIKFILTSRLPVCTGFPPSSYSELNLDDQGETMVAELQRFAALRLSNLMERQELCGAEKAISQKLFHSPATFLGIELLLKQLETVKLDTQTSTEDKVENMTSIVLEIYKSALSRVSVVEGALARRTLCWILYSFRSMTVDELVVALSLGNGNLASSSSRLDITQTLDSYFPCIIAIQQGMVELVHHSVGEFLFSAIGKADPGQYLSHGDLAQSCLLYLSTEGLGLESSEDSDSDSENGPSAAIKSGFGEYAAQYWPAHYKESTKTTYLVRDVSNFLKDGSRRNAWSDFYSQAWRIEPAQCTLWKESALFVATYLGFTEVVDMLVMEQNIRDMPPYSEQARAIELAADKGDRNMVKHLLEIKNPDTPKGEKSLHMAARKGHLGVVIELLTVRVDPNEVDESGSTPLHLAAQSGYLTVAKELLQSGAIRSKANKDGFTPLHLAARSGNLDMLQELLDDKETQSTLNSGEYNELTPLHLAAREGHTEIVKQLLKYGFRKVSSDNETSLLHLAAQYGRLGVIKLLLNAKDTALDDCDLDDRTPLELAARGGRLGAVRLFLQAEATRNTDKVNEAKSKALVLAARKGYELIVKLILEPSMSSHQEDSKTYTSLKRRPTSTNISEDSQSTKDTELYPRVPVDPTYIDRDTSMTPLSCAARGGHESVVRVLLNQPHIQPDLSDGTLKQTPLSHAAMFGHTPIVRLLLSHESVSLNSKDLSYGQTPLSWAAENGYDDVVRLLLDRPGIEIDAPDDSQHTPLYWASRNGETSTVRLLLDKGAQVEGGMEESALQAAVYTNSQEVVKLLLNYGAAINKESPPFGTALQTAAHRNNTELVRLLLKSGADCNASMDYEPALVHAANRASEEIVELLLKHGAHIQAKGKTYASALEAAAKRGNKGIVELLLTNGADIHSTGVLSAAASAGQLDIIQLLIDKGADVNQDQGNNHDTALHAAIQVRETDIVRFLLQNGAVMDRSCGKYATALEAAVSKEGNLDIIQLLINEGADVNQAQGDDHSTALQVAVQAGHKGAVELLLKNDADVNKVGVLNAAVHDLDMTRLLLDHDANVNLQHTTLLRTAIGKRHFGLVELLIERGVDVDTTNGEGALLLMAEAGNIATVKLLLDKGIDVNVRDERHAISLHHAASKLHHTVISLLLERGANVNSMNKKGCTALQETIKGFESEDGQMLKVTELLLSNDADATTKDTTGTTALHLAAALGRQDLVRLFLERFPEVDSRNCKGQTALHRAAINGHVDIVALLLRKGAMIDGSDKNGTPALHEAVRRDHFGVVRLLLQEGADINIMDNRGETCLHRAVEQGKEEILCYLLDLDASMDEEHETLLPNLLKMMGKKSRDYSTVVELLLRHCRVNKITIPEQDLALAREVQKTSESGDWEGGRYCDRCKGNLPRPDPFYHCLRCHDNNYDLCQDCIDLGLHCLDDGHQVDRFIWKGGLEKDWEDEEYSTLRGYKRENETED